jgi:hypothetical protein
MYSTVADLSYFFKIRMLFVRFLQSYGVNLVYSNPGLVKILDAFAR